MSDVEDGRSAATTGGGDETGGSSLAAFDAGRYLDDIADFDLTDAQAIELLTTLWSIMRACVELGFKVDVCGQVFAGADCPALSGIDWQDQQ